MAEENHSLVQIRHLPKGLDSEKVAMIIEKRVRKDIRINNWIKKGDNVLVINDGSTEYEVTKALLKSILKDLPVTLEEKRVSEGWEKNLLDYAQDYDRVIIPKDMDNEILGFFEALFFNQQINNNTSNKIITILQNVMESEVIAFATAKQLSIKKKEKTFLAKKMDEFEEKYPGMKFSVKKSMEELQKN